MAHFTFCIAIVVWMMRTAFEAVPAEVEEAGRIDGATAWQVFLHLALPMTRAGIAASAIFALLTSWNEFLFAVTLSRPDTQTMPVAIAAFVGDVYVSWGQLAAATVVGLLPALLLAFAGQRWLPAALAPARVQVDSPWYDERAPAVDFHTRLLAGIAMLLPSEADCLVWRPQVPPLDTAAALARQASRPVLVKRGDQGAVLLGADGQSSLACPACSVPVVDPTGAGDAFCGGFLAGLDAFADIGRAGACGTVSASFAIGGEGTDGLRDADAAEAARRLAWVLNTMERGVIVGGTVKLADAVAQGCRVSGGDHGAGTVRRI